MDAQHSPLPSPPAPHARGRRFRNRMASGLAVLIPLVVTVAVIRFLLTFTAGILLPVIDPAVAAWPPVWRAALSLTILFLVVYLLGVVATHVVGRRVISLGEAVVLRLPIVKVIYAASKQVVTAFQGRGARAFQSVVLVEFPHPGVRSIGFVTGSVTRPDGVWDSVFVPTTPNPTTGFLQLIPHERVTPTDYTVEEAVKMVMSLGVLFPNRLP